MSNGRSWQVRWLAFSVIGCVITIGCLTIGSRDAAAYQIKRIVRGNTTVASNIEVLSLDISGSLGGVDIDPEKAFVLFTTSINAGTTHRRNTDFYGLIDDGQHLLFARATAATTATIEYMVVEFSSGVTVVSGLTAMSETVFTKTVKLPSPGVTLSKAFPLVTTRTFNTSNTTDYQARRLNIKYRKQDGSLGFVHTLNGTAIATARAIIAILENFQTKDGNFVIPKVLEKYS